MFVIAEALGKTLNEILAISPEEYVYWRVYFRMKKTMEAGNSRVEQGLPRFSAR